MAARFSLRHDEPLVGDVDIESILACVPEGYAVKGMFLARYVAALGDAWGALAPALYPELFHAVTKGPLARSTRVGDRHVRVLLESTVGTPEQVIGIVEALVLGFDETPRLEVQLDPDERRFTLDVFW